MLENKEIIVTSLKKQDLRPLALMLSNEKIKETYMVSDYTDFKEYLKLAERIIELSKKKDHYIRGVYLSDQLIGMINDCGIEGDSLELGWFIDPEFQGKGYGSKAVSLAFKQLFDLGFQCIKAGAFVSNKASIALMRKNGMKQMEQTEQIEYRGQKHQCVYYCIEKS